MKASYRNNPLVYRFESWAPYAAVLLAFAIYSFRLDARTLHGDELHSVAEATTIGQNFNGIIYFALMHYWQMFASSEAWLRFPSVFFAVAAVAAGYVFGATVIDRRVGLFMALTLATSAFILEYAQQYRFYTLFLLSSILAYWAFVRFVRQPTPRRFLALGAANILAVGAHFFGALVLFSEILAGLWLTQGITRRTKAILCAGAGLAMLGLLAVPASQTFFYDVVARWTNPYGNPSYAGARGVSIANLAKIPLTFFFFEFGQHVYPLELAVVVSGLVAAAIVGGLGLATLYRQHRIGAVLAIQLALLPALVYLVFDPLSPPSLQGAAPRYLIFLLLLFVLVLVAGMQGKRSWLIVPVLLVNFLSLAFYWRGDWAYEDDLINWRQVRDWTSPFVSAETSLLVDGPSLPMANYYFPSAWKQNLVTGQRPAMSRAVLFSYDWHPKARAEMTTELGKTQEQLDVVAVWNQYPLFVYVYDRKSQPGTYTVDPGGRVRIRIPTEIYGLEFQDLRLPFTVQIGGVESTVVNAFGLPRLDGANAETIRISPTVRARKIALLSNLIGAGDVREGTVVAKLRVESADGNVEEIPLRVGYETNAWDRKCTTGNCSAAFSWRKRAALVGAQNYPEAWRDFGASIFMTELDLKSSRLVSALELERIPSPGKLYTWGIVLEN